MKYPIVLWDADGVTLKNSRLFSEQLEIDYGIKTEILLPFFKGVFRECSVGKADLKIELSKVIDTWGWQGTVEELMDYWFTKGTVVDKEMIKYIESIRDSGSRCFMTTDQEKYRGEYLKNLLGDGKPFEKIFYSAEIGTLKKDPQYFDYVYQVVNKVSLDTPPQVFTKDQFLFIDDDEKNIVAAKTFGFETHFFQSINDLKKILFVNPQNP